MASVQVFAVLAIVAAIFLSTALATEFVVGDAEGWSLKGNYTTWANAKMFMVGDSLVFNYTAGKHNVLKVSGPAFKACNASGALGTFNSGKDVVNLTTVGKKWYICGFPGHCDAGMKLVITVQASMLAPAGPPSTAPPSSSDAIATSVYPKMFAALATVIAMIVMV